MDTKNRLTNYLLKVAKKHRILTYPVLALVALISVFSYFFNWSTGAGKRIVAIVIVMVMLVSQSYFLTSSATEVTDDSVVTNEAGNTTSGNDLTDDSNVTPDDTGDDTDTVSDTVTDTDSLTDNTNNDDTGSTTNDDESGITAQSDDETQLLGAQETIKVVLDSVDYNHSNARVINSENTVTSSEDGSTYDFSTVKNTLKAAVSSKDSADECFKYSTDLYLDVNCSIPLGDSVSSSYVQTTKGNKSIVVYCLRELDKYKVTIVPGGTGEAGDVVEYKVGTDTYNAEKTLLVDATGSAGNKIGTLTITDAKRYGYDATTPVVSGNGSGSVGADGTTITVGLVGQDTAERTVTLGWQGKEYTVLYSHEKNSGTAPAESDCTPQTLIYGGNYSFLSQADAYAVDYPGYDFKQWNIGEGSVAASSSISMEQHKKLYKSDGSKQIIYPEYEDVSILIDKTEAKFQYRVPSSDIVIKPYYDYKVGNKDKNGNFTYDFVSGKMELAGIGIDVTTDSNGLHITSTNGPTATTLNNNPYALVFTVSDGTKTTGQFTVNVKIAPQTINIRDNYRWKTKTYDGDANVLGCSSPIKTGVIDPAGNPITISYSGTPTYDSKDAGTGKTISIPNPTLNVGHGYEDCYVLNTDTNGSLLINDCTIDKRVAILKTTCDINEIRTGEATPDASHFGFTLDPSTDFADGEDADDIGEVTFTTNPVRNEDNINTPIDKCYVVAQTSSSSNYEVKIYTDNMAYFKVVQEAPTLNGNYTLSGTPSADGDWYIGNAPVITPDKNSSLLGGGYDQIRISYDGGVTFSEWQSSVALSEEDSTNNNMKIQLKSDTGAITSVGSFTIKYDPAGPDYKGYSFTSDNEISYAWDDERTLGNGGLYFPSHGGVLSFGTYVKSVLHIKVKFEDNVSGLSKLNYGIFSSDLSGNTALFDENGVATIEVLRSAVQDGKGKITCQAVDKAGNRSDLIILRPKDNNNDEYEWSVEEKQPSQCSLSITYGDTEEGGLRGTVSNDSGIYYRNCKATLHVVDNESGIKNVKWYVDNTLVDTQYPDGTSATNLPGSKVTEADLTFGNNSIFVSRKTAYSVKAVVEDNAGNTRESSVISFLVDNDPPALHVDYEEDVNKWTSNEEITFTTSDDISDVAYAQVLKSDGSVTNISLSNPVDGVYTGKFTITGKGQYTVKVGDNAGNVHEETFNVQNISKEAPACPTVTVTPSPAVDDEGNEVADYWYNSETGAPTVTISNVTKTEDNTPAYTYYRHYKNDETAYDDVLINASEKNKSVKIADNDEGIHTFKYWSKSASDVNCIDWDKHLAVIRYDGTAPVIDVTNVPEESSGSSVLIRFTVKDDISGVDQDSIKVLRNGKAFDATIEETEDGYVGTFIVNETGNYIVCASDIAGNEANVAGFTPMSMVVNPVSNLTTSKATITANVYKGTADVTCAPTVSIRKQTEEEYKECENTLATQDENGNWSVSAVFDDLDENTVYVYKVHAVSDIDEVLEYEGYLKTASSTNDGGIIRGTVGYQDGTQLPEWNQNGVITIGLYDGNVCVAATVADAGGPFAFTNVADGTYTIVATDGVYTKSQGVTIDNHVVVRPGNAISLILSGQNTSVVITTPDTPNVIADNMDSIFLYDTVVNFNDEDRALIQANGTVEFRLYATLTSVVDVSKDELAIIQRVGSNGKIVAKYLNLTLEKITTDANGNMDRTQVSELSNGASITITIPLQDLAGKKGIEVVRIHDGSGGLEGYRYDVDMDSNPNTFTLTSSKFSTYAILYSPEQEPEDPSTEDPSTEDPGKDDPSNNDPGKDNPGKDDPNADGPKPIAPDDKTAQTSNNATSFGSVGSGSGSAKTGDTTPIVAFIIMTITLGGSLVIKRKIKKI